MQLRLAVRILTIETSAATTAKQAMTRISSYSLVQFSRKKRKSVRMASIDISPAIPSDTTARKAWDPGPWHAYANEDAEVLDDVSI